MFVWLFVLHLLNPASLLQTFDIRCPDSSQWQFKEKGFCNRSVPDYYCLLDENRNAPTEFCRNGSEFFRPGYKFVVSGALTGKLCSGDFFQPFKFWTNYSSECALTKSNCSEKGQNNFNNGNSTSDRACRCDHTKGYGFVHKPNNDCFCYPAYEDCSCYFRSCGHDYVLTPDYKCVKTSNWTGNYKCSKTGKESTRKTLQVEAKLSSMLNHSFWCQHLDAKDTYQRTSQKEDIKIFVFGVCTALVAMCLSIVFSVLQFPKCFNVHSVKMSFEKESNLEGMY
ncbi:unnamed protein product [Mytilus coruscus]|uniref:Uncharacterized protein n=1 Tax=Mytilus coruscus TaxID=42192 RepID=A0A6J8C4I9_MYTCO|nr:unnamed protein product [Mytilus coruscus]